VGKSGLGEADGVPQPRVAVGDLREAYDAVVLAYGAEAEKSLDGVDGADLEGIVPARAFVEWYNGALGAADMEGLVRARVANVDDASVAVIGHGNVALDVARMLVSPPEALRATDMPRSVGDVLAAAYQSLGKVTAIGRRGPQHAACTTKELREMTKLSGLSVHARGVAHADEWSPKHVSVAKALAGDRVRTRVFKLLASAFEHGHGSGLNEPVAAASAKAFIMAFYTQPIGFVADETGSGVAGVKVQLMERDPNDPNASRAVAGASAVIPASLVVTSIGYRSVPLPGAPFDEVRGVVPNVAGRVVGEDSLYAAGWVKRGPRGVIVATLNDAVKTADAVVSDLAAKEAGVARPAPDLAALAGLDPALVDEWVTTYADWKALDAMEIAAGSASGQSRAKLTTRADVFAALASIRRGGQA